MTRRRRRAGRNFTGEAHLFSVAEVGLTCPLVTAALEQLRVVVDRSIDYADVTTRRQGIREAFDRTFLLIRDGATLQLRRALEREIEKGLRMQDELDALRRRRAGRSRR